MNRKQGIIIVTLLVLIVCAGILAARVNSPLYVNDDSLGVGKSTLSLNSSDKKASSASFFAETRLSRDQKDSQTLQTLKTLMDDQNVSKENRDVAAKKYTSLANASANENKIESLLKTKGFDEAIAFLDEDKVRVIIQSKEQLTDKQTRQIKDIVMGITKIKDIEIETKE